jgi:hypothetical protein
LPWLHAAGFSAVHFNREGRRNEDSMSSFLPRHGMLHPRHVAQVQASPNFKKSFTQKCAELYDEPHSLVRLIFYD